MVYYSFLYIALFDLLITLLRIFLLMVIGDNWFVGFFFCGFILYVYHLSGSNCLIKSVDKCSFLFCFLEGIVQNQCYFFFKCFFVNPSKPGDFFLKRFLSKKLFLWEIQNYFEFFFLEWIFLVCNTQGVVPFLLSCLIFVYKVFLSIHLLIFQSLWGLQ